MQDARHRIKGKKIKKNHFDKIVAVFLFSYIPKTIKWNY